ncbi:hypothetical protein [Schleiferilactobacillus perolens]|uniref:Surface layer protein A domain-containing protein n=1 Tax=Schleiferilactobacillus perolens DSM 12744 TaxID=1423792 RepID=A0A0R1MWK8_9LACO|nr:hypothetical protein [Schleiferilactobacillus perolens]KRL12560.1 hypothetical protein FD09_GL002879 [Schleiferilactobacillus perolens DSM 12744]
MKVSKVLASLFLLGGIVLAGGVMNSASAPVHAATTEPAIIQLNDSTHMQTYQDDGTQNPGLTDKFTAGSRWRVTGTKVGKMGDDLYIRVATNTWLYYNTFDDANATLIAQLRADVQAYSQKQGNLGGYVIPTQVLNDIGKTLASTPVVERPGSTKVLRQLPAGTRWRLTARAYKPLVTKTDDSDVYFQIATGQWINIKYLGIEIRWGSPFIVNNTPVQAYRFNAATLQMDATTRQLKPYTAWRINGSHYLTVRGQAYLLVGQNEWVKPQQGSNK